MVFYERMKNLSKIAEVSNFFITYSFLSEVISVTLFELKKNQTKKTSNSTFRITF